jgi:Na+/proline symporter
VWLAALLAAVMAAVMASDSQILALSTMFAEDVFAYYGGTARFGQRMQVQTGRAFVIILTVVAYLLALGAPASIFSIATQYAFAGYAALSPLLVAALFWAASGGGARVTFLTAAAVAAVAIGQTSSRRQRVVVLLSPASQRRSRLLRAGCASRAPWVVSKVTPAGCRDPRLSAAPGPASGPEVGSRFGLLPVSIKARA